MKEPLKIEFHNPNDEEETALYLWDILMDMLVERIEENPERFFNFASSLIDGGEIEDSSLL